MHGNLNLHRYFLNQASIIIRENRKRVFINLIILYLMIVRFRLDVTRFASMPYFQDSTLIKEKTRDILMTYEPSLIFEAKNNQRNFEHLTFVERSL